MAIERINPGEEIKADWLNRLAEAAEGRRREPEAPGGVLGVVARVLAAIRPGEWVQCRVIGVQAPRGAGDTRIPVWPSERRYTVQGIGRPGVLLTGAEPSIGVEVEGDEAKVWPAKVGDICYLIRSPAKDNSGAVEADLLVFEKVARKTCGAGSGALRTNPPPIPPLPIVIPPTIPLGTLAAERAGIVGGDSGKTTGGVGGGVAGAGGDAGGAGGISGNDGGGSLA